MTTKTAEECRRAIMYKRDADGEWLATDDVVEASTLAELLRTLELPL